MKLAVAKYSVGKPADFGEFAARQRLILEEASRAGAELAVLPEYLALELAATFAPRDQPRPERLAGRAAASAAGVVDAVR